MVFRAPRLRSAALAAVVTFAAVPAAATAQTTPASQPSWLGTVVTAGESFLTAFGGTPAAIAYAPEGGDVILAKASGTGSKQVRVVVARHNSRTGKLAARGACLAFPARSGCTTLPDAPANVADVVVSADGRAVYLVGSGILTLARDPATGVLTPIPGAACLPPAGTARCQDGGPFLSLALPGSATAPADAPGYLADGATLRLVTRDPATGALSFAAGPQTCLSAAAVAGCTQAPGAGARGLQATDDGRNVYTAGLAGRDVSVFRASVTAPGTLTAPAPPLVVPDACPKNEECVVPGAYLSPDDRHLYLSHPVEGIETPFTSVPDLAFAIGVDWTVTPVTCGNGGCPQLIGPLAFSPQGDQVYAYEYGSTTGETLGATLSLATYARNAETGTLRSKTAFDIGQIDIVESAGAGPYRVAVSPDGQWVLDSDLNVLHRRTVKPPTISVKGLPKRGSCARRDARLRITVSGASRDGTKQTVADATFAGSESGVSRGTRRTTAASFTLKVRRSRKADILVSIFAPGKRGNDVAREVEFRFC